MTHRATPWAVLANVNRIAKIFAQKTTGRHRNAKQPHKIPNKTPGPKETAQELDAEHITDHHNHGNSKELREDIEDYINFQARRLTDLYKLFDIAPAKR